MNLAFLFNRLASCKSGTGALDESHFTTSVWRRSDHGINNAA